MNDTRVLLLVDWFNIGGTKTHAISLAKDFIKRGIKVSIAGTKGPLSRTFKREGCSVFFVNFRGVKSQVKQMIISDQLEKIILSERISMIHAHHPICVTYAAGIAQKYSIPIVLTVHGTFYRTSTLVPAVKYCHTVVSVGPSISTYLQKLGIPSMLIPNGINVEEFKPIENPKLKEILGIPFDSPVIVYPARLEGKKARIAFQVMEACHHLRSDGFPDLYCLIAGYGIQINDVRAKAKDWNSKHQQEFIHVLGRYYDMAGLYSTASCVIATGRSGLEVLACERPLIGVGTQGFFGPIHPNNLKNGWECLFGDHKHRRLPRSTKGLITAHLRGILLSSEEQRKINGNIGRNYIMNNFELSRVNEQLVKLYQTLSEPKE